jgi:hypothetical protein
MNNESLKILDKIKELKAKPKAKWYFILKNTLLWLGIVLSLLLSAVSFSAMLYLLKGIRFRVYTFGNPENWKMLFSSLPYFWIIFTAIFIFLLYYEFKRTKKGYLYPLSHIIIFAIISSTVLGYVLQASGLAEKFDRASAFHPPLYNRVINPQMNYWNQAEEGRLAGMVLEDLGGNYYQLLAIDGDSWKIKESEGFKGKIIEGEAVRLRGEIIAENTFFADEALPMGPGKGVFPHIMNPHFPDQVHGPGPQRMRR